MQHQVVRVGRECSGGEVEERKMRADEFEEVDEVRKDEREEDDWKGEREREK